MALNIKLPEGITPEEYNLFLEITGMTIDEVSALSGWRLVEHHRLVTQFIDAVYAREGVTKGETPFNVIRDIIWDTPGLRKSRKSSSL